MIKSIRRFAILASLLCGFVRVGSAQQEAPPEPEGTAEPAVKAPEKRREPLSLEDMVRSQRDARWERARSGLRQSLEEAGIGDKAQQDAVLDFAKAQDQAREKLREKAARCWDALRNPNVGEAELKAALGDYQEAGAEAQAQRERALAELETKVRFQSNTRLSMLLRLKGLLGSEAWLSGDALSESESFDLRALYPAAE